MLTRVIYTGDAVKKVFDIPFPYISTTHVSVRINLVPQNNPGDYFWRPDGKIEFLVAPPVNAKVEIYRSTEIATPLVEYHDGAVLTERELNLAVRQNLYLTQEITELWNSMLDGRLAALVSATTTTENIIDSVVQEVLNSALLDELQQRINDIDTNASDILAAYIDINDLRDRVEELTAIDLDGLDTLILNEQNERIVGDTALANTLALIGARNGPGTAFVLNLNTVKVSSTESMADRLDAITARFGTNEALIAAETNARATADSAFVGSLTTLQARMSTAEAAITTETAARVTADSSIATQITTINSTLNGNTAAIQTLQTVTNGLAASYVVKTDVNGYVSGFGLYNSGGTSQFVILADKFALVTPGQSSVVPFAVDASGVYMQNAYIRNLNVDKITGGTIGSQWNINNANGRIVLDTGTHMKVIGVGFGANSDLVEWFGVKQAVNLCTRANGITWVATNGDAYFGGSLSAGTIYNSQQTTNTASNAEVILGPFGTAGRSKTVVVSYSFFQELIQPTYSMSGFTAGSGTTSATIEILRKIGSGSEVVVASFTAAGNLFINNEFDGTDDATYRISGSTTFTDTDTSTGSFQYRARITARTQQSVSHPLGYSVFATTQNISIVSTEV